jgi:hypothetical protein
MAHSAAIWAYGAAIEGAVAIQKRHERTHQIERGMANTKTNVANGTTHDEAMAITTTDKQELVAY